MGSSTSGTIQRARRSIHYTLTSCKLTASSSTAAPVAILFPPLASTSAFIGTAEFVSEDCVEVAADGDRRRLNFAHCVVATGASPALPDVPGLREAPYRTHLSWYDCEELPRRAVVLGGGPQAAETAQALSVLGCRVCLAARGEFLPREDAAAASVVRRELEADGVEILTNVSFVAVSVDEAEALPVGVAIRETNDFYASEKRVLRCDALLVAAGRKPRVAGLGLDAARVAYDAQNGIRVDGMLRTSNPRIFAAGDVASGYQHAHAAVAMAAAASSSVRHAPRPGSKDRASRSTASWASQPAMESSGARSTSAAWA